MWFPKDVPWIIISIFPVCREERNVWNDPNTSIYHKMRHSLFSNLKSTLSGFQNYNLECGYIVTKRNSLNFVCFSKKVLLFQSDIQFLEWFKYNKAFSELYGYKRSLTLLGKAWGFKQWCPIMPSGCKKIFLKCGRSWQTGGHASLN